MLKENLNRFDGFVGFGFDAQNKLVVTHAEYSGQVIHEELENSVKYSSSLTNQSR